MVPTGLLRNLEDINNALFFWYQYFGTDFQHPDKIINEKGKGVFAYYNEMVDSDAVLGGLIESRASAIACLDWEIEPVSEDESDIEIADFVNQQFKNNDKFPVWITNIFQEAMTTGYSVQLINWILKDGKYLIDDLISIMPDAFRFDPATRGLRILELQNPSEGREAEPYRWLVMSFKPRYANPYGVSVLRSIYWLWWFKHYGYKWWLQAAERGAVVSPWGYFPANATPEEQAQLATSLKNFLGNKFGTSKEGTKVEFPHITIDPELASKLIESLNAEMRYRIEGSELASGTAESGTRALGETHLERYQTRIESDAKALMAVINTLIRWIVEINYGDITPPRFKLRYELPKDTTADRLNLETAAKLGIPISVEDAADLLKLPLADEGETNLIKAPVQQNPFAPGQPINEPEPEEEPEEEIDEEVSEEPESGKQRALDIGGKYFRELMKAKNQDHIRRLEDAVLEDGFDSYMGVRKQIIDAIQGVASVAGALNILIYFTPDMTKLEDYLYKAYFWVFLHGYHDLFDNPRVKAIRDKRKRHNIFNYFKSLLDSFKGADKSDEPGWIPVTPEKAIEAFKKKKVLTRRQFDILDEYSKRTSLTAAGLTKTAIQNGLRNSLLDALEKGTTLPDFKKSLINEDIILTKAHAETVFRTNIMSAYNDGHLQAMFDPELEDVIPGFEFVAIMDDRTTEECAERNGEVYTREQVESAGVAPPLHYNCRSTIIPVFEDEGRAISDNPSVDAMKGFGIWHPLDLE